MSDTDAGALRLDAIAKRFRTGDGVLEILRGASLAVAPGAMVALVGPSGAGNGDGSVVIDGIGVGIAQENTELKARIDKALCELVADGSIGKASQTWFKTDISRACK